MSTGNDEDSQMLSSPSDSDTQTPQAASTILSPPDSQQLRQDRQVPNTASPTTSEANENGKRPYEDISNGAETATEARQPSQQINGNNNKPKQDFPTKTHERSGYSWSREEDAPGYAWENRKAVDEYNRAWDGLVHRDAMVGARFGDPFEMADREKALRNSLTQQ